ncbi:hypothetical protein ANANG_G00231340, partial [Anguilla anguilla]
MIACRGFLAYPVCLTTAPDSVAVGSRTGWYPTLPASPPGSVPASRSPLSRPVLELLAVLAFMEDSHTGFESDDLSSPTCWKACPSSRSNQQEIPVKCNLKFIFISWTIHTCKKGKKKKGMRSCETWGIKKRCFI